MCGVSGCPCGPATCSWLCFSSQIMTLDAICMALSCHFTMGMIPQKPQRALLVPDISLQDKSQG